MTLADYVALGNQWPVTDSVPNPQAPSFCRASFSAAPGCPYGLGSNQSATVYIGDDTLYDDGCASSPCAGHPLTCNTAYVFRVVALDDSGQYLGEFSDTIDCATQPCVPPGNCTYTQGYWRTHPEAWPVTSLTLGTVSYTQSQLLQIFGQPAEGNGLLILAHQLMAAKLNIANGADPADAAQAIADADAMIGSLVVPPVGNGYLPPSQTSDLTETLTQNNEGTIGPGHCDN